MPNLRTALAGTALLVAVVVVSIRVLGPLRATGGPSVHVHAMSDFRDVVYDPVIAFLDGENPYDRATFGRKYPGMFGIGLYSPLILLLHLPLGFLSIWTAAVVYYCVSLALTMALAPLALRLCGVEATAARTLGLAALLVASRPGHWNLLTGQVTLPVTIGTYLALGWARTRPGLAGLGLALASFKPTYGVPLAGLLLARGDRRTIGVGFTLAALLTGAAIAILAAHCGFGPLLASVLATYQEHATDPSKSAAVAPFRVDVVALVGRLLGRAPGYGASIALTLGALGLAALALRRLAAHPECAARALAAGLGTLAILVCMYHQQYDLVGLALPLTMVLWPAHDGPWPRHRLLRGLALVLLALLLGNYLSSETGAQWLGLGPADLLALGSANGIALLALFGIFAVVAFRWERQPAHAGGRH